jgi:molybdate transport system ATP-binding protein
VSGALEAVLGVRRGGFALDVRLELAPGTVLALLGRNGAGKSTALAALAGLVPLDTGRIELDGRVLDDPGAGRLVPPERRPVGTVLQSAALFPHLTALDNVAFGLRTAGASRESARHRAMHALEREGLAELADRRPAALSGGQSARIALVRTLVREPALLLLDEPLAAIDAEQRPPLRERIAARLAAFPGSALLVTHDVRDAEGLADEIAVLDAGRLVQRGSLSTLRDAPASETVARLVEA